VPDTNKIPKLFADYLDEYNAENKEMRLVFFWDACDHVNRLARVLRQPRGNPMLSNPRRREAEPERAPEPEPEPEPGPGPEPEPEPEPER
jgi:hypothetical protein